MTIDSNAYDGESVIIISVVHLAKNLIEARTIIYMIRTAVTKLTKLVTSTGAHKRLEVPKFSQIVK